MRRGYTSGAGVKRSPLARKTRLERKAPLRQKARRKRSPWRAPLGDAICEHCRSARAVHRHHIVNEQVCERHGASTSDARNLMKLCGRCHFNHHAFAERLPRPSDDHPVHAFVAEHGLGWWLDRFYPEED